MEVFIIILVIYAIFNGIAKKKKREAEQARRAAAMREVQNKTQGQAQYGDPRFPQMQGTAQSKPVYSDPRFPQMQGTAQSRPVYNDPRFPEYMPPEGSESLEGAGSLEGHSKEQLHEAEFYRQAPSPQRHSGHIVKKSVSDAKSGVSKSVKATEAALKTKLETIKSSFADDLEGGFVIPHSHTESSLSGIHAPCPPVLAKSPAELGKGANAQTALLHSLLGDKQGLISGIIFSEVWGKPKAMRRA